MRKRRGLLIGLGIGLMLGASILQLILTAEANSSSINLSGTALTQDELAKEAKSQGYVLVDSSLRTYTQDELDAAVLKAKAEASSNAAGEDATTEETQADSAKDGEGTVTPSAQPSEAEDSSTEEEHTYSFYIRANASLIEVATGLQEMGLIADKDQFVLKAKPYSKNLRVGTSTFVGNPTFEEIIAEITRAKY